MRKARLAVFCRAGCIVLSTLGVTSAAAKADSCSLVIPGAQMGPAPDFNSWPWTDACYISWPGIDSRDYSRNPRLEYENQCKQTTGFLHFEGDFGSNKNTCIFKQPAEDTSLTHQPTKETNEPYNNKVQEPEWLNTGPDGVYHPGRLPSDNAPSETDYHAIALMVLEGERLYRAGKYQEAGSSFNKASEQFSNKDVNIKTSNAKSEQALQYIECMHDITTTLNSTAARKNWAEIASGECRHTGGALVQDGLSKINAFGVVPPIAMPDANTKETTVDGGCLQMREPRNTGVGCAKGKVWFMTHVGVLKSSSRQCPASVRFQYVDEDGDERAEAPTTLQTCGGPPANVQVVP